MDAADRLRGVAVGAAVGDALGMPLEFGGRIASHRLVREMQAGRIPAGSFTDDTEMALALAPPMLASRPGACYAGSRRAKGGRRPRRLCRRAVPTSQATAP